MASSTKTLLQGRGCLGSLPDRLAENGLRNPLFVVDKGVHSVLPAVQALVKGRSVFFGVYSNPTVAHALEGVAAYRAAGADGIVAVGGGSAIDLSKSICAFVNAPPGVDPTDIARGATPLPTPVPTLAAVPTTSGTGSEATQFAVIWINGKKFSLADPRLRPAIVALDSSLTDGLPAGVTAPTGLDALCQAAESVWSVGATDASVAMGVKAIRLAAAHLVGSVKQRTPEHREGMMEAAHLAGCAIDVTRTTAPHAISYTMTGEYGVPHGHAVALTFPGVLRFNAKLSEADCSDPRGASAVRARLALICEALDVPNAEAAAARFEQMVDACGLARSLEEVGIADATKRLAVLDGVNLQRLGNNPRKLGREQLRKILDDIAFRKPAAAL